MTDWPFLPLVLIACTLVMICPSYLHIKFLNYIINVVCFYLSFFMVPSSVRDVNYVIIWDGVSPRGGDIFKHIFT